MDAERYHSPYTDDSPYGLAVSLLSRHARRDGAGDGVVVDIGCGYGAIAEAVRQLGLAYLGIDTEPAGLADLAGRGFETAVVDLAENEGLRERIAAALGGRPLAAFSALDVIEHLTNGEELLAVLWDLATDGGGVPLVVSIPNVTHLDLAAKLLLGRWDVTPVGLLDVTHVSLYSPARLERAFVETRWQEIAGEDFLLAESDQHFPAEAAPLAETPLRSLIARLRTRAAPGALVNQFIRAYLPVPSAAAEAVGNSAPDGDSEGETPFLSLLLLADHEVSPHPDAGLGDLLLSLEAQRSKDFELLVLAGGGGSRREEELAPLLAGLSGELSARTRTLPGAAGRGEALTAGAQAARGRYVAVLDRRSVLFAHYVESFARLSTERPGAVLRCLAVAQPMRPAGPVGFEAAGAPALASAPRLLLDEHVFQPLSPPGSYALPRSCFVDLGLSYAEAVRGAEEEDVLLEAVMLCGVHETPDEINLVRRRFPGDGLDGAEDSARQLLAVKLDSEPLLLPTGSIARFWDRREALRLASLAAAERKATGGNGRPVELEAVRGQLEDARRAMAAARGELEELRRSTSWRVTAPLRRLVELARPPR